MNHVERKRQQIDTCTHALALVIILLLGRGLGSTGIAFIGVGLEGFLLVWSLCGGAVSDTLGRMLRSRNSKGQYKNAEKLRKSAMVVQLAVGLLGTIALLITGQIPHFGFVLTLFAPAVFLHGVVAVLSGYFQGEGTELPRVAVSVLRLIFLLGFGWMFGRMFAGYGEKVSALLGNELFTAMYGAGGIALAFTLSEVFLMLFLLLLYKGSRKPKHREEKEGLKTTDSMGRQIQALYGMMWTRMGVLFLTSLPPLLSAVFLLGKEEERLQNTGQYGIFLITYLFPVLVVLLLLGAALLPGIWKTVQSGRREEQRNARVHFLGGLHGAMLFGLFFAVFSAIMAEQISACMLEDGAAGAKYLQQGSALLVFLMLLLYFIRIMLLLNQPYAVLAALGLGNIIYIGSVLLLTGFLSGGVNVLIYGGMAGAGISCLLSGALTCRRLRAAPDILQMLVVPGAVASVAGLVCLLLGKALTPHVGNLAAVLICLVVGMLVYLVALLLLRNIKEQELNAIPFGKLLRALGQLLRVF